MKFPFLKLATLAGASLALSATPVFADTVFAVSEGVQPSNVGTITLHQVDSDTVTVTVDLLDTYGFMNSGGKHTPFAFTLSGSETGVSADFVTPTDGKYGPGNAYSFSLNLLGGDATPFGTFGVAIDSSAPNGSGSAYYGDLVFNLSRTGGLLESDFIANSLDYYFGADLTDGQNTGSQGWKTPGTSVPDSGMTAILLGLGLVTISIFARRRTA